MVGGEEGKAKGVIPLLNDELFDKYENELHPFGMFLLFLNVIV